MVKIWIDGDGCPKEVRREVFAVSKRWGVVVTWVANSEMKMPDSDLVELVVVGAGADVADEVIAKRVRGGDVVVTGDIPLAAEVVRRGAVAVDIRGTVYTDANVWERLAERNALAAQREEGEVVVGLQAYCDEDRWRFAAALERVLEEKGKSGI